MYLGGAAVVVRSDSRSGAAWRKARRSGGIPTHSPALAQNFRPADVSDIAAAVFRLLGIPESSHSDE